MNQRKVTPGFTRHPIDDPRRVIEFTSPASDATWCQERSGDEADRLPGLLATGDREVLDSPFFTALCSSPPPRPF